MLIRFAGNQTRISDMPMVSEKAWLSELYRKKKG
jgi:hypothetical protein